jgi:hypothetical protein
MIDSLNQVLEKCFQATDPPGRGQDGQQDDLENADPYRPQFMAARTSRNFQKWDSFRVMEKKRRSPATMTINGAS